MKKILLLCAALLALFVSCSKEDSSNPSTYSKDMLIGDWSCTFVERTVINNGQESTEHHDIDSYGKIMELHFGENDTLCIELFEADTLYMTISFKYDISDNKIIPVVEYPQLEYNIQQLTASHLTLYYYSGLRHFDSPEGPLDTESKSLYKFIRK